MTICQAYRLKWDLATYCLGLAGHGILPLSVSQVAGVTGVSYHTELSGFFLYYLLENLVKLYQVWDQKILHVVLIPYAP
jgi:hypothetical protein